MAIKTKGDIDELIKNQLEENLSLEYKSAASLGRSDGKKRELTKDISSFANAAGGTIIFGLKEFDDRSRRHLPERFDPINSNDFAKEWLDQICGLIKPRIDNLAISPIHVGPAPTDFVYVVDIPQSSTAHQALDLRYYKRRNFESSPMEDY